MDASPVGLDSAHLVVLGCLGMADSLFSPLWYRYASQRPQLRPHVSIQPQQYRDQTWYLLINNTNKEHFRVNTAAYAFVGRCNGEFTVEEIWDSLLDSLGNDAPTQSEVISLLNELDYRELLRYDVLPDIPILFKKDKDKQKSKRRNAINPFAFKFGLWNPTPLLNFLSWLPKLIFNPFMLVIWLVAISFASMFVASNWTEIYVHFKTYMNVPRYLLIAWLSYPLIKAVHELGHALAVRRWGGDVRESGITLFMLTPAPYVDASAANGFKQRYQRTMVSAIGIMVELTIAAFALLIFFNTQQSMLRDVAFVVMVICGFSSLLFNGNPLLRFDAYYALTDMLDLPNLATRSRQYWTNLITKRVVGGAHTPIFEVAKGETKWLFMHAPLAIAFTFTIFFSILFWLGEKSFALAMVGGLYLLYSMVCKPLWALSHHIVQAVPAGVERLTARGTIAIVLACLALLVFFVPLPSTTAVQGVVWVQDEARLRPETAGFIRELPVAHGDLVRKGQTIAVLEDPDLMVEKHKLINQVTKLEADQYHVWFNDPAKAEDIGAQINKVKTELTRCEEKIAALTIISQTDGKLVMPYQQDLVDTFANKGKVLGYVLNDAPIQIRAALPAHYVNQVKEKLHHIEVKLYDHQQALTAKIINLAPASSYTLPSAALGDRGGGNLTIAPDDKDGIETVEPIVLVDLTLPNTVFQRAGARVNVLFNHGNAPIAQQLFRRMQQLFLKHFNSNT